MATKEMKSFSITLKVSEMLYEGYTKELNEAEREQFRMECRKLLANTIHNKRFNPEEWDIEE